MLEQRHYPLGSRAQRAAGPSGGHTSTWGRLLETVQPALRTGLWAPEDGEMNARVGTTPSVLSLRPGRGQDSGNFGVRPLRWNGGAPTPSCRFAE